MKLRGNRLFYVDTGEPADIDTSRLLDRSDPALGRYRGGRVQAFRNGGVASIADLARHYGMRR